MRALWARWWPKIVAAGAFVLAILAALLGARHAQLRAERRRQEARETVATARGLDAGLRAAEAQEQRVRDVAHADAAIARADAESARHKREDIDRELRQHTTRTARLEAFRRDHGLRAPPPRRGAAPDGRKSAG